MDTPIKNLTKGEKENVLLVLNEFSEDHKTNSKAISMLIASVKENTLKINGYLDKEKKEPATAATVQQIEKLEKYMEELKRITLTQPREVKQEKRILLFPEHGAKEYYGTVLRWILYIIIATYCFLLLKYLIDVMK